MVLLIIIPMKNCYFIGNINPTVSDKPISKNFPRNASRAVDAVRAMGGSQKVPKMVISVQLLQHRGDFPELCQFTRG